MRDRLPILANVCSTPLVHPRGRQEVAGRTSRSRYSMPTGTRVSNNNRVIFQDWAPVDCTAVALILREAWGDDPVALDNFGVHGPRRDELSSRSRTIVGTVNGDIITVGTVWESPLHPAHWRVSIHVRDGYRACGVGSQLFSMLDAIVQRVDNRPIQVSTRATDTSGLTFLERQNFRPLMRTHLGTLSPSDISPATWNLLAGASVRVEEMGFRIRSMEELGNIPGVRRTIAGLHAEVYRSVHSWNPPVQFSDDLAESVFLDKRELLENALYIALIDDRPVAVASLREIPGQKELDLGWVGVASDYQSDARPLVAAVLERCLRHAVRRGATVKIEVDEADQILWTIARRIPVAWEPDWLTYLRVHEMVLKK